MVLNPSSVRIFPLSCFQVDFSVSSMPHQSNQAQTYTAGNQSYTTGNPNTSTTNTGSTPSGNSGSAKVNPGGYSGYVNTASGYTAW